MKLSDYIVQFLAENLGICHIFGIVGGGNAHLVDSLAKNPRIKFICTQHEQGAAMAAEAYSRTTGNAGVVLITSGPGGTNAMTGLCCAWMDSIPCIFISGQVPLTLTTDGKTIRQLGVQQINIIDGVKPYTKYAVMIKNPQEIKYHLEKAIFLAKAGRPGPVWLDVPANVQSAIIDPDELIGYTERAEESLGGNNLDDSIIQQIRKMISKSKRPVVIAGNGIRIGNPQNGPALLLKLVEKLKFPVLTTWSGIDLIDHGHSLYIGSAGVMGQRGANYAVANSDLIIAIGSRMDTRQVGNSPNLYARDAKKIVVDIDPHELAKGLIKIDLPIKADACEFMMVITNCVEPAEVPDVSDWSLKCREWKNKYPIILPDYFATKDRVNSYVFIDELCKYLGDDDIVVTDMGTSLTCTRQTFKIKGRQRLFANIGLASMGYGLPGAIGAWFGGGGRRVIGIFGDGGLQMSVQELQTVFHHGMPLKMFVLNNEGYLTLKHTQEMFFDGHYSGSEPSSGYSSPKFSEIARAYKIASHKIDNSAGLDTLLKRIFSDEYKNQPVLCEVMMPVDQPLIPLSILDKSRGYAGAPIERMYPFISEDEHRSNMLIEPA